MSVADRRRRFRWADDPKIIQGYTTPCLRPWRRRLGEELKRFVSQRNNRATGSSRWRRSLREKTLIRPAGPAGAATRALPSHSAVLFRWRAAIAAASRRL